MKILSRLVVTSLASLCALVALLLSNNVYADDITVQVQASFIDVHTGPASEYPVFYVALQGEDITVLKKRTSWYKVKTKTGIEGWISAKSLGQTITPSGKALSVPVGSFDDFSARKVELTLYGGLFDNVTSMSVALGYKFTDNIIAEANYTQALGSTSQNKIWALRLQHYMFPEWRLSPYLTIGAGQLTTTPRSNLVESGDESRKSDQYEVGGGVRYYFSENTVVKVEYRRLTALTTRDEQEVVEEWRIGFSVFF